MRAEFTAGQFLLELDSHEVALLRKVLHEADVEDAEAMEFVYALEEELEVG